MPSLIQSSFSGGERAPEYAGRTDDENYRHSLLLSRNMIVLPGAGGATHRPGFQRSALAKFSQRSNTTLLERFAPRTSTVFTLEFGPNYLRFYRTRAQIFSAGVPLELATPWGAGDIQGLMFTQIGATLYIWSRAHPPQILTWGGTGNADWNLSAMASTDGPYIDAVGGGTTITPSAAAGSATCTASSINGINNNTGFQASDVGRLIRFHQKSYGLSSWGAIVAAGAGYQVGELITWGGGVFLRPAKSTVSAIGGGGGITNGFVTDPGQYLSRPANPASQSSTTGSGTGLTDNLVFALALEADIWTWGIITAVHSTVSVDVTMQPVTIDATRATVAGQFVTTNAISEWRLGAWCPFEGFPGAGALFQGRLVVGGTANQPKRRWGSETRGAVGSYNSFAPSLGTGQVIDSSALDDVLDDQDATQINWLSAAGKAQIPQLAIGAGDAEFIDEASPTGQAITPTSGQIYRETRYGNSAVAPLYIGRALIFVDGAAIRLRQWTYQWTAGGYIGPEVSPYIRHLLSPGIRQIDYQLSPYPIIWVVLNDGSLAGVTYQLDEQPQIAAGHSHVLGGSWYGGPPLVESVAVCPSETVGSEDEIWISVLRSDGGSETRAIEVSTAYFRGVPLDRSVFVDAAIASAQTFPNATCSAVPGPFGPDGTALPARGDTVNFTFDQNVAAAGDTTPGTVLRFNGGNFRVTAVSGPRAIATECMDPPNSLQPLASTLWSYTAMKTSWTGFDAHDGLTVTVIGDGALYGTQVVANGTIVLPPPGASYVIAGLYAPAILETLDLDLPAQDGTSQMKTGRFDHLYLRVFETAGGSYGPTIDNLDDIEPRDSGDVADWPPALVTDDLRVAFPGGSSEKHRVVVRQNDPWPMTLLALVVKGGTTEQAPR